MIVLTGPSGQVGGEVLRGLLERGEQVRAVCRHPERIEWPGGAPPDGVEVLAADLTDVDVLGVMLQGAERLYLMAPEDHEEVVNAARVAGVQRVVLLSSYAVQLLPASHPLAERHMRAEEALRGCGLDWTVLRPGWFCSNVLHWTRQLRRGDELRVAHADVAHRPVHPSDVAATAIEALTSSQHSRAIYPLLGPEQLTAREQVGILGEVLQRELQCLEVSPHDARSLMGRNIDQRSADALIEALGVSEVEGAGDLESPSLAVPSQWRSSASGTDDAAVAAQRTFRQWVQEHRPALEGQPATVG